MAYLSIKQLNKFYGDFAALKQISLEIEEGEFVCFLGPSGCGKTTLLRAIAGLDMQTDGAIYQSGRDISWLPTNKRDFGIVFQSYALFPNLTVADNIAYGLHNTKAPKQQVASRVCELLQLIGLPDYANQYPAQLSGGQQQRVALARAIATEPGLLLLDEPLSALDAKVRVHLRHEIKELQRKLGVTTIMVTHDQEEALAMADKIVVMDHGVIVQVGTPEEIYNAPVNEFVASFVGAMNFLPSRIMNGHQMKVGSHSLECDRCSSFVVDEEVMVAIRPEDIRVRASQQVTNRLPARVTRTEFLGAFVRTELDLDGIGQPLVADFTTHDVRELNIVAGAQVMLGLPDNRMHLFGR